MRANNSIEKRVFLIFGSFALCLSIAYSIFTVIFANIVEDELLEKILEQEASYIKQKFKSGHTEPKPRSANFSLYLSSQQLPKAIQEKLSESPNKKEFFGDESGHFHALTIDLNENTKAYLVYEVSALLVARKYSGTIFTLLVIALFISVAISVWISYLIAKRTTHPIVALTKKVKEQLHLDETVKFNIQDEDEISYLAKVIEDSTNSLKDTLQRETHFTRDVSHELRTPLTEMQNLISLRQNKALEDEDIVQLKSSLEKISSTVSTLLSIARHESISFSEIRLRPVLEECVLALHERLVNREFEVTLDIPEALKVTGSAQLITLVTNNLLENALQHSSFPNLKIAYKNGDIVFENTSKPILEADLTLPKVKNFHSEGIGQGLFLTKRICEKLNWQLHLEHNSDIFRVTLKTEQMAL